MKKCKYYSLSYVVSIPTCSFKSEPLATYRELKKSKKIKCRGNINKCQAIKEIFDALMKG